MSRKYTNKIRLWIRYAANINDSSATWYVNRGSSVCTRWLLDIWFRDKTFAFFSLLSPSSRLSVSVESKRSVPVIEKAGAWSWLLDSAYYKNAWTFTPILPAQLRRGCGFTSSKLENIVSIGRKCVEEDDRMFSEITDTAHLAGLNKPAILRQYVGEYSIWSRGFFPSFFLYFFFLSSIPLVFFRYFFFNLFRSPIFLLPFCLDIAPQLRTFRNNRITGPCSSVWLCYFICFPFSCPATQFTTSLRRRAIYKVTDQV
jgi:hypothetical protein